MHSPTRLLLALTLAACGGRHVILTSSSSGSTGGTGSPGGSTGGTTGSGSTGGTTGGSGSTCYNDDDCVGPTCAFMAPCPGVCVPYLTLDQGCGWLKDGSGPTGGCAPGLYCDPRALRCLLDPLPDAGVFVDAGSFCSILGPSCNPGLFCAGIFPDNGYCSPVGGDGGPCPPYDAANGCADGLLCVGSGDSPDSGTCLPPTDGGGGCLEGNDRNGSSGCIWGLVCVGGICAAPPTSGPCLQDVFSCDYRSSFCDPMTNTCQPKEALGSACSGDLQCASGLCDLTQRCGQTLSPAP